MGNTGIIITMAYPETIVMVADEWYSPFLRYLGIGKKNYLRAGHAALVLIDKSTGVLEYHDFGRYITPEPNGRVRGKDTDNELDFPLVAKIENDEIKNLDEVLKFLGTHPKLTHGDGKLVASVCNAVDYQKARAHITEMQNKHFIRYAAFIKNACNCARFVTDSLIASVNDMLIKKALEKSKWFTPSTVGNVLLADTENYVCEVSETGVISEFKGSQKSENIRYFLDRLKAHKVNLVGTLKPKYNNEKADHAQWLSGIAAGAWFELYNNGDDNTYRFRRISPYGNVDCDAAFRVDDTSFNYDLPYEFVHYSNCKFIHVKQGEQVFRFNVLH
ncbi:DUF6695 family protein [Hyunsoonleella pacifica]|uniref:Uncharacterized protein n=1 Tax=Hyunsoonleella pacifica TaxID=1080224 RepID=A0A4Q9FNI7_9FLAO|nr:DUF6695 family protein [Hyunsoonleella pacifica]TBN15524.1 hypothetical protein EYD46_10340 [Hyunsoonleella pacifica]GGD24748.1 hypothetical protein GCM10011368_28580 [Hyunsoonleella pacifica]